MRSRAGQVRVLMFQVRFHGRGGQGVVTAAELLSVAAFDQGRHAQALPSFGSERTGAPVVAYCRIDDQPIRSHDPVTAPEAVVVQDPTMLHLPGVLDDLAVGRRRARQQLPYAVRARASTDAPRAGASPCRRPTWPGSGSAGRCPTPACSGALAGLTGVVDLDALQLAMRERFSGEAGDLNARSRPTGSPGPARTGGSASCAGRLRARAPSPRPSPAAGPTWWRRTRSRPQTHIVEALSDLVELGEVGAAAST